MTTRSAPTVKSPSAWPGRSHVSIFIHSMHLLDLDKRDDWPGLTGQTFDAKLAQQNQQSRVRAIEWSLYRLFELYDAGETRDKLRPFFPPLAPLQSVNLRAALYRCLTELKKNGVLGKEVILRKTMLDDCKGDKFEEAIAGLAMVVLKKVAGRKGSHLGGLDKTKFASGQKLPLILAYRKSLQENLRTRNELRLEHEESMRVLRDAEQTIKERTAQAETDTKIIEPGAAEDLRRLFEANWIGDQGWIDVALYGPPIKPVIEVSNLAGLGEVHKSAKPANTSNLLLDELEAKIKAYEARLGEWTATAERLRQAELKGPSSYVTEVDSVTPHSRKQHFTRHQQLHMGQGNPEQGPVATLQPEYQELLVALQEQTNIEQIHPAESGQMKLESSSPHSQYGSPSAASSNTSARIRHEQGISPHESGNAHSQGHNEIAGSESERKDGHAHSASLPSSPISVISDDGSSSWIPKLKATSKIMETPTRVQKYILNISTSASTRTDSQIKSPGSPEKEWFSLMDRTRASMAGAHGQAYKFDPDSPETNIENSTLSEAQSSPAIESHTTVSDDLEHRSTLLERTRQSMSLINMDKIRPRKQASKNNRTSQLFPVNQFETPGRKSMMQEFDSEITDSRSSTPLEKLFGEEADYASVFKSRPRIAMSPVTLSPERTGAGLESILEVDMQRLDIGSDDDVR